MIPFSPPDITQAEIDEVVDTLKSGWITTGPKTKEFERQIAEYCGTNKAVCLNSATAGLEIILRIMGIGPGDEVITSAYTYTASASVIRHVSADIVLCDTACDGFEIDYDALKRSITSRTKAVILVDIAGKICDYERAFSILEEKKGLFNGNNALQNAFGRPLLIADAAHSFGAIKNGMKSGAHADFTSFSFHAVKNLTTAEGGAVVWRSQPFINDEEMYRDFMLWSLHGQSKDALTKNKAGAWEYDIKICGLKCNMTDIMAAIGLAQLKRYASLLARRRQIIEKYDSIIKKVADTVVHYGDDFQSSGHLYLARVKGIGVEQRNKIISLMAEKGIAVNVHYKPLPLMTAYKELGFDIKNYPDAYSKYITEITLPLHTLLTDEEVDYVSHTFVECVNKVKENA